MCFDCRIVPHGRVMVLLGKTNLFSRGWALGQGVGVEIPVMKKHPHQVVHR